MQPVHNSGSVAQRIGHVLFPGPAEFMTTRRPLAVNGATDPVPDTSLQGGTALAVPFCSTHGASSLIDFHRVSGRHNTAFIFIGFGLVESNFEECAARTAIQTRISFRHMELAPQGWQGVRVPSQRSFKAIPQIAYRQEDPFPKRNFTADVTNNGTDGSGFDGKQEMQVPVPAIF